MKKKCMIITVVSFIVLLALTFVLPQEIPLHFGATGLGTEANKYLILLFTPAPTLIYWACVNKYKK